MSQHLLATPRVAANEQSGEQQLGSQRGRWARLPPHASVALAWGGGFMIPDSRGPGTQALPNLSNSVSLSHATEHSQTGASWLTGPTNTTLTPDGVAPHGPSAFTGPTNTELGSDRECSP